MTVKTRLFNINSATLVQIIPLWSLTASRDTTGIRRWWNQYRWFRYLVAGGSGLLSGWSLGTEDGFTSFPLLTPLKQSNR